MQHPAPAHKDSHLRRASRSAAVCSSAAAAASTDARGCTIDGLPPPLRRSAGSAAGWYSACVLTPSQRRNQTANP